MPHRDYNGPYTGEYLDHIAFPLGGIGAGMLCIEGSGALSHFSLCHTPDVFNEPMVFSAICIKDARENTARLLEGPTPRRKAFGAPGAANGAPWHTWGLPRFKETTFLARFPFAYISLRDPKLQLEVDLSAWSPFIPSNADDSSLPVVGIEFRFCNTSAKVMDAVYSFNSGNFIAKVMGGASIKSSRAGFTLYQPGSETNPWEERSFRAEVIGEQQVYVNTAWFRGGWWDPLTIAWKDIQDGACFNAGPLTDGAPSPGATIFVPLHLEPGKVRIIHLALTWHVPASNLRQGKDTEDACCTSEKSGYYTPWYTSRFPDIVSLADYWKSNYEALRTSSKYFSDCFYDQTLPPEIIEAVSANLSILKSPTVLRQADGRLWAWEGCGDVEGCCHGSCTHVWNYAQTVPHLFHNLERTLRETEFGDSQDERGHQMFRSSLPIRQPAHDFQAAADGQLGGIMKVYREWRISGDTGWLRKIWPKVRKSLDYCIETWDPRRTGLLEEPHHNTYDIEFWGPNGMSGSFYLGALSAAVEMGRALEDNTQLYSELLEKGGERMESELYNGEYFVQKVQWEGLSTHPPFDDPLYSPEAKDLLQIEGPKYQYGKGCLSDGVLGAWMGEVCGVPEFLERGKIVSSLRSIFNYNFKKDLSAHANPQRSTFALGTEGGLLLCTWPHGEQPRLPFVYSNEVWTGIEYQVASHLIMHGMVEEGLQIVRTCRARYDGRARNPFDEYECGHWYARAMASYSLLQAFSGVRYDAVEKTLYIHPRVKGDFKSFISTANGYGTVGVRHGQAFLDVRHGQILLEHINYKPCV